MSGRAAQGCIDIIMKAKGCAEANQPHEKTCSQTQAFWGTHKQHNRQKYADNQYPHQAEPAVVHLLKNPAFPEVVNLSHIEKS